jgi:hypothetical protein
MESRSQGGSLSKTNHSESFKINESIYLCCVADFLLEEHKRKRGLST